MPLRVIEYQLRNDIEEGIGEGGQYGKGEGLEVSNEFRKEDQDVGVEGERDGYLTEGSARICSGLFGEGGCGGDYVFS